MNLVEMMTYLALLGPNRNNGAANLLGLLKLLANESEDSVEPVLVQHGFGLDHQSPLPTVLLVPGLKLRILPLGGDAILEEMHVHAPLELARLDNVVVQAARRARGGTSVASFSIIANCK